MNFSYYEVYNNALRAFRGLDFPYGADEDAAYIISWLELNNLNGIKILSSNLNNYDKSYKGNFKVKNILKNSFDLENYSSLMVGPNLIDYITTKKLENNENVYEIKNCSYFIYFIPLLAKLLKKQIFSLIKNKNKVICNINDNRVSIDNYLLKNINSKDDFIIYFNNKYEYNENLDININLNNYKKKLSFSLKPNKEDWEKVSKIAFRTYVPESDESRKKGAGGGNDND